MNTMAAIPALVLPALAALFPNQSASADGPDGARLTETVSAAEATFEAELGDLRRVTEALEKAQIDVQAAVAARLPRFVELAEQGSGRSAAYALVHYAVPPEQGWREREDKLVLYRVIERSFAGQAWLLQPEFDVFPALRRDAPLLGAPRARTLARNLREGARSAALRARSLLAEAWIDLDLAPRDPASERRARALLQEVIDLHPETAAAQEAAETLWRLDRLVPGAVAPDFVAKDIDGNELRLSDWDTGVVLVDFWSSKDPRAEERLSSRRALFERFREERFALIGINLDGQEHAYRRNVEEFEVEWPNVFTGGPDERVIWTIRGPASFVLAPGRVIRFADLGEGELEQAIEQLLAEGKEVGDSGAGGSSPPLH